MKARNAIVELISGFPDFKAEGFDIVTYNQQFKNKNLVISAKAKQVFYDKHWGPLSLKFSFGGNEQYITGNSRYSVHDNNFLVLNQDTEYSSYIDSDKEVESFTLNFCEQYIRSFYASLVLSQEAVLDNYLQQQVQLPVFVERLYRQEEQISGIVSQIHRRLHDFYGHNNEVAELFAGLFMALLHHNAGIHREIEQVQKTKASTRQELYRRLNYAKDYMDSCYADELQLDDIAAVACLNREYFIRQFKNHFHITPTQYLINRRMQEAKRLLQYTSADISEICQQVGYSDLSSFGKLFRRYHQVSPTEWKKGV